MPLTIQTATPQDETAWRGLWQGFLDFYGVKLDPAITAATWARILDPAHPMTCRMAVLDAKAVGFAIHHHHGSSWVLGDDCYLEDLFVAPEARGAGVGRALIEDLIALAAARGWHRLYWNTEEGNSRARGLYDQFTKSDGHIRYRMRVSGA